MKDLGSAEHLQPDLHTSTLSLQHYVGLGRSKEVVDRYQVCAQDQQKTDEETEAVNRTEGHGDLVVMVMDWKIPGKMGLHTGYSTFQVWVFATILRIARY